MVMSCGYRTPFDRRATLLEMTEDGFCQLRQIRRMHAANAAEIFAILTPAEHHQLVQILDRLQSAAPEEASEGSFRPPV